MADDDLMVVDSDQLDSDNASKEKQDAFGEKRKLGANILQDFEDVLSSDVDFGGSFSFHEKVSDAPNPFLTLKSLGTIGLPLSVREAVAVKANCQQAPFGMGERTVVDKTVRDTWEMNASEVTFENPKWPKFISEMTQKACDALGVDYYACEPRCELHKLLLYEEGSHFLAHVDSEKSDGMVATIVIVLPSLFTGGDAHISHNGITRVYDCSEQSKVVTHVMAWFTDVKHEIKPVQSGYRLALSYNLIRTTETLRPPLQNNELLAENISRVLESWKGKRSDPSAPEKIIYRLSHEYSIANLKGSALKSVDGQRFSYLLPAAERHGFKIGLAYIDLHLSGSWAQEDPFNKPFEWHRTESARVNHLVDLEGNVLVDELAYDSKRETIPDDLGYNLEKVPADEEESTEYTGNEGCTMDRWYNLSGLVIWPEENNHLIRYSGTKGWTKACEEVKARVGQVTEPSAHYHELLDIVSRRFAMWDHRPAPVVYHDAFGVLLADAVARNDFAQWTKTVRHYRPHMLDENIWPAIQKWGFPAIRPEMENIVKLLDVYPDYELRSRGNELLAFDRWLNSTNPADEGNTSSSIAEARTWIQARTQHILDRLCPEGNATDRLVELIGVSGGLSMLTDSVIDKVKASPYEDYVLAFATAVFQSATLPECEQKTRIVTTLV